jgi:hypothetical protein
MSWQELFELGADHHGVVGPRCAVAAGISVSRFLAWGRRLDLAEPFPKTFLLPGWTDDERSRAFAAALAIGRDAVLTGWTSLAQLELTRSWPATPELLVPANARTLQLPGTRTRWSRVLPESSLLDVGGVRFTDAARSLAQVAGRTSLPRLRAIGFDAVNQGLLDTDKLDREIAARGRFHGRGAIRQLARDLSSDGSESGFEFDARDRLVADGLSPDLEQPRLSTASGRSRRIDIAFSRHLVGIECVSFAYHSSPAHLEADAVRANEIAELDQWLILRLTWRMFYNDWPAFLAQLRRCLAARAQR